MKRIFTIIISCIAYACVPSPDETNIFSSPQPLSIYPDYRNVTIPCNIAPLNFMLSDSFSAVHVVAQSGNSIVRSDARGNKVIFNEKDWHQLLRTSADASICISIVAQCGSVWLSDTFSISISTDSIDPYVTYRLIEPGYEVWNEIAIEERCLENFYTRPLALNKRLNNNCMNCHLHGQGGQTTLFHIRGKGGATFLCRNGILRKTYLRSEQMRGGAVYGDIDCTGQFGVFSTNNIIPALHSTCNNRLEVYDTESDLCIADFDNGQMILSPIVADTATLETFPCFSADGKQVFYCSSPLPQPVSPDNVRNLHYAILSISFDGTAWGTKTDTIWHSDNGSASLLKASPNNKFIAFTHSAYGTFPIWHKESDLWIVGTDGSNPHPLTSANSDRSDSYHTWSSNSRWIVFASKRYDGQYGRVCITHIDTLGNATKAFIMPQADPSYDIINLKSYNIPDISPCPAPYSIEQVEKIFWENNGK